MVALSAFHAKPELRAAALQRLSAHIDAQQLTSGPLAWDGEKGSVVGCLIESSDPLVWQDQLGLAKWLAHALDTVTGRLSPADALQKATVLLNALPLGADTGPLGNRLIASLLAEIEGASPLPEGLKQSLQAVTGLHQRAQAGEPVDAPAWKAARKAALAATDEFDEEKQAREHALGGAIEAAAWDPQRSPMAVAEVLRYWLQLEGLKANEEFGWTEADDANIRMLLNRMYEDYIVPNPDEKRTVFTFLEEHHADESTRLRAMMKHGREHGVKCVERAADLLLRLLQTES